MTDPTGTYQFTFDNSFGGLQVEPAPDGARLTQAATQYTFLTGRNFTIAYTYDKASNRTGFTDSEGGSTAYVYDTLNRLQTLTPPTAFSGGSSFGFTYDALSRRTQMTRPNSITTNYSYDNLSRLLSVLHQTGATTLDGATYTVDNAGNRTAKTDQYANVTSNYTYDPIYELTQVTQATNTTESYTYDAVGNRLSSLGVSPYSNNSSNELTSTPSTTYTYDYNGNTLVKTDSTGSTSYTWDFENRLTSVTLPGTDGTGGYYNPTTGCYTNRGQIVCNWQGYAETFGNNNPDESGLDSLLPQGPSGAGNGGGGGGGGGTGGNANCIATRVLAVIPGSQPLNSGQDQGGHQQTNFTFSGNLSAFTSIAANSFSIFGVNNGYRFGGVFFSLHINSVSFNPNTNTTSFQGHEDVFNPATGLFGILGHTVVDLGIGTLLFNHSSRLDRRCP